MRDLPREKLFLVDALLLVLLPDLVEFSDHRDNVPAKQILFVQELR